MGMSSTRGAHNLAGVPGKVSCGNGYRPFPLSIGLGFLIFRVIIVSWREMGWKHPWHPGLCQIPEIFSD